MRGALSLLSALLLTIACSGGASEPAPPTATEQPASEASPTVAATQAGTEATSEASPASMPLYGVSLSPRSFGADDFTRFFDEAAQVGGAVEWAGDWAQLAATGEAPEATVELGERYGYTPVVIGNVYDSNEGPVRPLDAANVETYKQKAVDFVSQHDVPYLGLGIEINILRERWPEDFEAFVALFDETYDLVKAASPNTQVFTVFQLERLQGLHGGLFGGVNDPSQSQWDILDRFVKADFFAFTTYPGIVFGTPADIPADHYDVIQQYTDKPIAFTEIGWPSILDFEGWMSDEAEQAAFIERFFELTTDLQPRLLIWSFLYDIGLGDPFRGIGLLREDGSQRPAWQAWNAGRNQ